MEEKENSESILPGPTPDPSKIPSVVREVGELDIEGKIEELGIAKISDPIISELIEFFESISELELCVEGGGDQIIIYKLNERIDPKELNKFMDKGMEVFSKFTKLSSELRFSETLQVAASEDI